MKKFTAVLIALIMLASCMVSCAMAEGKYPTKWDLGDLFKSSEEWNKAYEKAEAIADRIGSFKGKLNTVDGLYDYLETKFEEGFERLDNRMYIYAYLKASLDPSDSEANRMMSQINNLESDFGEKTAFEEPELIAIPFEERQKLFADPKLAPYAHYFRKLKDPDYEPLGEEAGQVAAVLESAMKKDKKTYNTLITLDMPYLTVTMPDGTEKAVKDSVYNEIISNPDNPRDFKKEAAEAHLASYVPYVNTYASLLNNFYQQILAIAKVHKFNTVLDKSMDDRDIDPAVFPLLVKAANDAIPAMQRYFKAHKKAAGLDEQYTFDLSKPASAHKDKKVTYDEAVDKVKDALSILGEEYMSTFDDIINASHVDVYPAEKKTSGGYEYGYGQREWLPYVFLNFNGYVEDVETLAHEMGHAVFSALSGKTQKAVNGEASNFTHEIASETNEVLFLEYLKKNAETDEEKQFYLEREIYLFYVCFFTQMLFEEFEDACYKIVEGGGALTAEELTRLFGEIDKKYFGDDVTMLKNHEYRWIGVQHFYLEYYMMSYAADIVYAFLIANDILSGDRKAVDNYIEFLKLGSSESPKQLIAKLGIDITDEKVYRKAVDIFEGLVEEYEKLTAK